MPEIDVLMEGLRLFEDAIFFYFFKENKKPIVFGRDQVKTLNTFASIIEYCRLAQKTVSDDFTVLYA